MAAQNNAFLAQTDHTNALRFAKASLILVLHKTLKTVANDDNYHLLTA